MKYSNEYLRILLNVTNLETIIFKGILFVQYYQFTEFIFHILVFGNFLL